MSRQRRQIGSQADERAHDPALGLPSLAEHDHVMAGDERVGELRKHGLFVADNAREQWLAGAKTGQKIATHLLLDRLAPVSAGAKLGDGLRPARGHHCTIDKETAALGLVSNRSTQVPFLNAVMLTGRLDSIDSRALRGCA